MEQNRHLARMRQASRQASRQVEAMEIAAPQRRDLAKMREDSTPRHTYIQSRMSKKLVTLLDLCVSSLRRGHANLLCIVPILSDDPRRGIHWAVSKKGAYPAPSRHHQCHGWPFTIDIPLLAFFRPQQLGASVPMFFIPQHCLLAAACHTCTCPRKHAWQRHPTY